MSTTTTTATVTAPSTMPKPSAFSSSKYSWEVGPMQLITTPKSQTGSDDQFTWMASDMACVHNCIIRALNSIYLQARHVPPREHINFSRYALAVYQCLEAHHHGEETIFFPEVERITGETGLMDSNVAGHRDFEENFHAWGVWLKSLKDEPQTNKFDGDKCVRMMDAFIPPLNTHLYDEIPTLLALERFGDLLDLKAMGEAEGKQVMGGLSKTEQLPALFLNHDIEYEGGIHISFPPVPAPVRWLLREVFGRWQKEWFKFATCGFDGKPKELLYLGKGN